MKKPILIAILFLQYFLFWNQSIAQQTIFKYHPAVELHLGSCFNIKSPLIKRNRAIKIIEIPPDQGNKISFRTYGIQKSSDLATALGIDVNVEASSLNFNGSADFGYNVSSESRNRSLTVVFNATIEYASKSLNEEYQLTAEAKRDSARLENDSLFSPEAFARKYGTHFVVTEKRGASLSIIVTINNVSEDTKTSITSSARGEGGFGFGSLKASAAFMNQIKRADVSKDLTINIDASGLEDNRQVADFLKQIAKREKNIDTLQVYMATLLEQLSGKYSRPIEYLVAPLSILVPRLEELGDLGDTHQQSRLIELVDEYKKIRSREYIIKQILDGKDPRGDSLTPADKNTLKIALSKYRQYTDTLAKIHKASLKNNKISNCCDIPVIPGLPDGSEIPYNRKWVIQFYSDRDLKDAAGVGHRWAAALSVIPGVYPDTPGNLNLSNVSAYKIDSLFYLIKNDNVNVIKTRKEVDSEMRKLSSDPKAAGIPMRVIDLYDLCPTGFVEDELIVGSRSMTISRCK